MDEAYHAAVMFVALASWAAIICLLAGQVGSADRDLYSDRNPTKRTHVEMNSGSCRMDVFGP